MLGLEVELGIAEIYKKQPLHSDVIQLIEECGFVFIDFTVLRRWERHDLNTTFGQLVFGDGLFLRQPEYILSNFSDDKSVIKKYISVCCLYNRYDLIKVLTRAIEQDRETVDALKCLVKRFNRFATLRRYCYVLARALGSEFALHGNY